MEKNQDLEGAVKANITFLQQCGLSVSDIARLMLRAPRMFLLETERVKEIVLCADKLGVTGLPQIRDAQASPGAHLQH